MVFNDGGDQPGVIYRRDDGAMAVSLRPSVRDVYDHTWGKMTEADIQRDADEYITADGSQGKFVDRIKAGKCLIFYTHAQTLYGNGTKSGLQGLPDCHRPPAEALRRPDPVDDRSGDLPPLLPARQVKERRAPIHGGLTFVVAA